MNPKLVEKLKKLLGMAKGGNGNEADIALEKAQQIAAENDIDLAVVALHDDKPEKMEMVENKTVYKKRLPIFSRYARWILENHFNVLVLIGGSRYSGREIFILGDKKDVEFAEYVMAFIQEDMQRRWTYYYKSSGGRVELRLKGTWAYAVYEGLNRKLEDAKVAAVKNKIESMPESIRPAVENKYALMVVNKQSEVREFMETLYPYLRKKRKSSGTYLDIDYSRHDVKSDGFRTGLSMNISRPIAGQKSLT